MAPQLNHPPGVNFVDEQPHRGIHIDAATYYGGGETFTRSRTYSHVCSLLLSCSLSTSTDVFNIN